MVGDVATRRSPNPHQMVEVRKRLTALGAVCKSPKRCPREKIGRAHRILRQLSDPPDGTIGPARCSVRAQAVAEGLRFAAADVALLRNGRQIEEVSLRCQRRLDPRR